MDTILFPFSHYWWLYAAFTGFVLLMLAVDLGVFHRKAHAVSTREAAAWSAVWVSLALAFNWLLYLFASWKFGGATGSRLGLEFLTGYIIEKTLSVDNIFVFVLVFGFFAIPSIYQHRVLFYGILGALVFRAAFIALGSVLVRYEWVVLLFGIFLAATGIKILILPEAKIDPERNVAVRLLRRLAPVTPRLNGQSFLVRIGGRWHVTPLLLALAMIEASDILFAVDSVPAIFAVTREPLIVFTSNVFAILGLRAMYFLLAGAVERFHLLKYGLGLVLVFVGLKMAWLNHAFGGKFPTAWSLAIIATIVGASMAASLLRARQAEG